MTDWTGWFAHVEENGSVTMGHLCGYRKNFGLNYMSSTSLDRALEEEDHECAVPPLGLLVEDLDAPAENAHYPTDTESNR
jgi:hypothetical protein